MNRFEKALSFTAAIMLSGCAGAVGSPWSDSEDLPRIIVEIDPPSPEAELMYRILVGEIAGQRGQLEVALENYQAAARASTDPRLAERAAGIALLMKEDTAALEMARRWYALEPDNVQARQTLSLALLRNHHIEEAIPHLEAVRAAATEDDQQGFATVGALLSQVEDKELAFQVMQVLHARQPQSPFALYYYALAALDIGDYETALEGLNAALALEPQWVPAQVLRARVRIERGDTDAALQELAKGVAAQPQNQELRIGYARLLVDAGRLEEARHQFEVLAIQNPKDTQPLYALGLLAIEVGQLEEAATYFMKLLGLGQRLQDAYYELGRIEELRGNYSKARDWYAQVRTGDRYLNAQVQIGVMLAREGDFSAMATHLANLRQEHPQNTVFFYLAEAEILREEGRYQAAFDLLSEALKENPDDQDLLYSRALAAEKIDRLDILERDLRRLIEADPNSGHALNALGYTLADRTDRYQEALSYLQRAIALLPQDAAVLDSMGWVKYRLGHYEESLDYLRRAYALAPDAEIAAHLVEVLWVSGRQDEARALWQQAIETDPDNEYLLKVKERFDL